MRVSEIIALKKDAVDLVQGKIIVKRSFSRKSKQIIETTKNNHIRMILLSSTMKTLLQKLMTTNKSDFVFETQIHNHLSYEYIRKSFVKDQAKAKMKQIGIHGLRHSFATEFLRQGGALPMLQKILGHADYETTLRYAKVVPDTYMAAQSMVRFEPQIIENVVELKIPNLFPTIEGKSEQEYALRKKSSVKISH